MLVKPRLKEAAQDDVKALADADAAESEGAHEPEPIADVARRGF